MKIAILGTRGVPNNYGGFEQFAEYISVGLVELGHEVTVYNPHFHPYKDSEFKGVKIIRKYSPEKYLGASANFIYDFICLRHALTKDFDLIYEAGYQSVSIFYPLFKTFKIPIITNMDGLEWRRSKWGKVTRRLTKYFEKLALLHSTYLISDNKGIYDYYKNNHNKESFILEYGAEEIEDFSFESLKEYKEIIGNGYYLIIARLEPENNIEVIIDGFIRSNAQSNKKLIVIGNHATKYGAFLKDKYHCSLERVKFIGGIYNKYILDNLRHFSEIYFHGHSVGGTNPSLLEAMAARSFIVAHDNQFNKAVLENDALFFNSTEEVANIIDSIDIKEYREDYTKKNLEKIRSYYSWETIVKKHEELFLKISE